MTTSGTDFQLIESEFDATGYDGYKFQIIITGTTNENLDVKWIDIQPIANLFATKIDMGSSVFVTQYAGSPESNVTADPGSFCLDTTNGEAYIKKTGTGNTGWKLVTHA